MRTSRGGAGRSRHKALAPLGHCALVPIGSESDLQTGISPTMGPETVPRREPKTENRKPKELKPKLKNSNSIDVWMDIFIEVGTGADHSAMSPASGEGARGRGGRAAHI